MVLAFNGDISRWVDLLEDHLKLVEKSESLAAFTAHDTFNGLRVELDVERAQGRLQLFKVHHEVRSCIPNGESVKMVGTYLVEKF